MSITILDPCLTKQYRRLLKTEGGDRFEECWNGRYVVPPLPNRQHQLIAFGLAPVFHEAVVMPGLGLTYLGVNVSDRASGWRRNYRGPDVAVYLAGNPAVGHENHMQGGPDFLIEIISPGERPKAKFKFYAKISTREILLLHRDPWALELYQLRAGKLEPAGRSDLSSPTALASGVLPLTFQLVAAPDRPQILVAHQSDGRTWLV